MQKKFKVSEKTLEYMEAVVYILAVIAVIFANVYGNMYIKMIPLLFVLGIVGNILFDRQVITTTFGIVMSMCLIHLKTGIPIVENIFLSFVTGLQIILGEFLGKYIKRVYKYSKPGKKISRKKKAKTKTIAFIAIFVSLGVHLYVNGSYLAYSVAKENLISYLKEKEIKEFKIEDTKFNFAYNRNYQFLVTNSQTGITSKYIIYLKDIDLVIDEYAEVLNAKEDTKLVSNISKIVEEKYSGYSFNVQENNLAQRLLYINKKVETVDNNIKEEFSREIVEIIKKINDEKLLERVDIIQISISSKNVENECIADIDLSLYKEYINDDIKAYEHIRAVLDMQYLDF